MQRAVSCVLSRARSDHALMAPHADRVASLLHKPCLVRDEHRVAVAQVRHDELADVVTHRLGIPHRGPQQPLHRLRTAVTSMLGQPPAVLVLHR